MEEFEAAEIEVLGEVIPTQRRGKFSEVFWPFEASETGVAKIHFTELFGLLGVSGAGAALIL